MDQSFSRDSSSVHASLVPDLPKVGKACSVTDTLKGIKVLRLASFDVTLCSMSVMVPVLKGDLAAFPGC